MNNKFILDACCGGRMFWFNQKHPNVMYIDKRNLQKGHCPQRKSHSVLPDKVMDFTNLEFENNSFKLVVYDPPHLKTLGETSYMAQKYGVLNAETWQGDLKKGFKECWRVLEDYGTLIFKWSETEITLKAVLKLFPYDPLFGHTTGSKEQTKWICFMKIPKEVKR